MTPRCGVAPLKLVASLQPSPLRVFKRYTSAAPEFYRRHCGRRSWTAPGPMSPWPASGDDSLARRSHMPLPCRLTLPDLALARQEVAGLAVALEDARNRVLPTLGRGAAPEALASALGQLQRALSQAEAAVDEHAVAPATAAGARRRMEANLLFDSQVPLGHARAAAAQLGVEAGRRPDLDVVLLVLERITAVAR